MHDQMNGEINKLADTAKGNPQELCCNESGIGLVV